MHYILKNSNKKKRHEIQIRMLEGKNVQIVNSLESEDS